MRSEQTSLWIPMLSVLLGMACGGCASSGQQVCDKCGKVHVGSVHTVQGKKITQDPFRNYVPSAPKLKPAKEYFPEPPVPEKMVTPPVPGAFREDESSAPLFQSVSNEVEVSEPTDGAPRYEYIWFLPLEFPDQVVDGSGMEEARIETEWNDAPAYTDAGEANDLVVPVSEQTTVDSFETTTLPTWEELVGGN